MNTHMRRRLLHLSILVIVPLAAGLGARAFAEQEPAPTPATTLSAGNQGPSATLAVVAPSDAQPPGTQFEFTTNLSELRLSDKASEWSTYDFELAYDGSVLEIDSVVPGLCHPKNVWVKVTLSPSAVTGCVGQQSTLTGVLETFTGRCINPGNSPLHIESRTALASELTLPFDLTLIDSSVACADGPTPLPSATPTVTPKATPAPAGGSTRLAATLSIVGPADTQPIGVPFEITSNLSDLSLTEAGPAWAGYDFELAYDPSVIEIASVVPNLCKPMGVWANPLKAPHVVTGCYAQQETSAGALETMTAKCLKEGSSPLHIVAYRAPDVDFAGTLLFTQNVAPTFELTIRDGSVTCGGNVGPDTGSRTPG